MQQRVKENYLISGWFAFFLVNALAGNGFIQNILFKDAEQDTWISVLFMGLSLHIIIWMIYKMLGNPSKDVIDLHRMIFGSFLGNAVSLLLIAYFFMLALSVFRSYIDILQIWVFPSLKTWVLAVILIIMIYYLVSGGFRVLTGFAFFAVIMSYILIILNIFPIRYGIFTYLLPVWNHSVHDLFKSFKTSCGMFMGFETMLIYFPFLKSPEKNAKWAHFGLLITTLQYTTIIVTTLMYFSHGLLMHTLYPVLVETKIIEFDFLERIEYIFAVSMLIIIIPMLCISIWSCTRIMKRITQLKPRISLPLILIAFFIVIIQFNDRIKVDELGRFVSEVGFYFLFAYIPSIFIIYMIVTKIFAKKRGDLMNENSVN